MLIFKKLWETVPISTPPGGTKKTFCLAFSAAFSAALRRAPRYCTDKMLRESSWGAEKNRWIFGFLPHEVAVLWREKCAHILYEYHVH
jgi:hypothetical protein